MLRKAQIAVLAALGVVLWLIVALILRRRPEELVNPSTGFVLFATAPLTGWLSVGLCKRAGRLSPNQLLPGVALVGAVAMMLDGVALKWFSGIYGFDEQALRADAAWLLWGYGVAFAIALIWAGRSQRSAR